MSRIWCTKKNDTSRQQRIQCTYTEGVQVKLDISATFKDIFTCRDAGLYFARCYDNFSDISNANTYPKYILLDKIQSDKSKQFNKTGKYIDVEVAKTKTTRVVVGKLEYTLDEVGTNHCWSSPFRMHRRMSGLIFSNANLNSAFISYHFQNLQSCNPVITQFLLKSRVKMVNCLNSVSEYRSKFGFKKVNTNPLLIRAKSCNPFYENPNQCSPGN